ncbi:coiled-coil domain-containing protein 24 [Anguilla rostrata]|uniref:coiled-coil domain-containing protein 24 n=1 Tax=Anguilla rostrata TaxID=7938 RepID=UPI0030D61A70
MAHQPDDGNSDFMESYEPAPPAWFLLKEHIPESELPEIRGILGGALIDLCTDTYSEVEMWVQIWKDVRRKRGGRAEPPRPLLADSPVVKELLKAEVRLLLLSLKEKAAREGRDEEATLSCYSPSVVSYVMSSSGQRSRTQSAGSHLAPQEAPSRPQSAKSLQEVRSGSRLSASSGGEDRVDDVKHKLNVRDVHEVVAHLKSVLTEDVESMKREIQFLQECVEQKHQSQCDGLAQEPTVSELKEERKLIQKDLKLGEATPCPRLARVTSAGHGLLQGCRPVGQRCGSSAGAAVWSPPPVFSKDKPPLARPPRLPAEPSLPPASTARPPARVLDRSRRTPESPFHRGNEVLRRCGEAGTPGSAPELLPANPASSTAPDTGDTRPAADSNAREERARTSSPGLSGYSPSCSPFPASVAQPRPPAQRQTRDEDTAPASPVSALKPAPPAVQKPATRGQNVARRLRLPQGGLVSPT